MENLLPIVKRYQTKAEWLRFYTSSRDERQWYAGYIEALKMISELIRTGEVKQ